MHGGKAPQVVFAAERRLLRAEALAEAGTLGCSIDVDDGEALVAMRSEAAANVVVYRHLVADLDQDHLYGALYHKDGGATGEAKPHVLVVMYDAERDRVAKLDEVCVKLGLAERREAREQRLADAEVERLYLATSAALKAAELTPEQRKAFTQALAKELRPHDG
jgi:hypothetical protein